MSNRKAPSARVLRRLLDYCPETGVLTWKARPIWMFKASNFARSWNSRYAGKRAFAVSDKLGRLRGELFAKVYLAHRVAFAHYHGRWPSKFIDHINGDPSDNRIMNLRDVPRSENDVNRKRYSTNTSGFQGVSWHKTSSKWVVSISMNGSRNHLGYFESYEAAVAARKAAEAKFGFHPNHGRAA